MLTLAVGPQTTAPSWEWVGLGMAGELQKYFKVVLFRDFSQVPDANILMIVKQRPQAVFTAAAKARGARIVYVPIDIYESEQEIAEDAAMLRDCDLVLLHSGALRAYIAPFCPAVALVEHHARYALDELLPARPDGFVLWVGGCQHVPYLIHWLQAQRPSYEVRLLTDLHNRRARIAAHVAAHEMGLSLKFDATAINGYPAFDWSEAAQDQMMRHCAAAIDIKGSSFSQITKPPTKAQQFIASGIPFACNAGNSIAEYFEAHDFAVAEANDAGRLFSRDYWEETRAFAPRLREWTSLESVGRNYLKHLRALY